MVRRIIVSGIIAVSLLTAATIKPAYRATNTALTATALSSLVSSTSQSTGIWSSAFVDNTVNLDVDEQVYVQVTTGSSGVSSTGSYSVYAYGCVGGTTTCTDGLSGTQGTATLTNPTNLVKLAACNAVVTSISYTCGPFSVANAFGGAVPARWGIVVQNLTGAAFASSGNAVTYDSVQMTSN